MKKAFLLMAACALMGQAVNAQEPVLAPSAICDNWYFGVEAGASTKITHSALLKNINPQIGLRAGRYLTPVFGFALEGQAYFRSRSFVSVPTFVKAFDLDVLGTVNLTNWVKGYAGEPRFFELVLVAGPGWNHVFGFDGEPNNDLTAKLGLDFSFNLGADKEWQVFVEPSFCWNLDRDRRTTFNANSSALQLLVGLNYKLGNTNGTHNFATATLRDQHEIDQLNARINELTYADEQKAKQLKANAKTIDQLKAELEAARNAAP